MTEVAVGRTPALDRMMRGGVANLIGAAVTAVCTFGLTVAVARGVSRADAGVFFSVTSLFLVATAIGQLGTQTALVYFLARARAAGRTERFDAYLRTALVPVLAVAVAMAVAVFAVAGPLAELTSPHHVGPARVYLRVLAPFIPVVGFEAALLAATRGLGAMRPSAMIEQIARPLGQLVLVIVATFAASAGVLGLAWSLTYVPAAIAAWVAWRALRARRPAPAPAPDEPATTSAPQAPLVPPGEFWKFALPRALTSVFQVIMQRFDIVLVGAIAGAPDAAVYAAATRFIVVGQLGTNALTNAAQPQLAERIASGDRAGTNELYQTSTAWLILVAWPLYFVLIVFGKPLLLVFGRGYSGGSTAILIIACSMLVSTGLGIVDTVLAMAGRTAWNTGNALLALAVNIGLDVLLIPDHGIVGAAIGWAAAIVVRNVTAVVQVVKSLHAHPFAASTAWAAALTTGCYLCLLLIVRAAVGDRPIGLLIGLLVGTVVYLAGLWGLRRRLRLDALAGLRKKR